MDMSIDIKRALGRFAISDLSPRAELREAAGSFAAWAAFGCALAMASQWRRDGATWAYMRQAANDGLGANIWNVMGVCGLALAGVMLILPRWPTLAKTAAKVWANTFAAGSLGVGVLAGRLPFALAAAHVPAWQAALCGAVGVLLLADMALMNFMAWYFGFLARAAAEGRPFGEKLAQVEPRLRHILGALLIAGPIALLLLER